MSFTVNYDKATTQTRYMKAGGHNATIKYVSIKEFEKEVELEGGDLVRVIHENINILLENANGEIVWDTIFHNLNETGEYLVYDEKRLNMYSVAVEIPNGTHFNTINEWIDYVTGRKLFVSVNENNYTNRAGKEVSGVRAGFVKKYDKNLDVEEGIAF